MKSPFPGMDPYLERYWRDVHSRLVIYASDVMNAQLPSDLRCRVEERVVVEPEEGSSRNIFPDVRVVERPGQGPGGSTVVLEATEVTKPMLISVPHEKPTETFLEVIDIASGKHVVTVLEFLSLSNKLRGPSRKQYRRKQKELRKGGVSLVEIDLLRKGRPVQALPESYIPRDSRTPYRACVYRAWRGDKFEYYPIPLRAPLPAIAVPLRKKDADVRLALQPLIEQCYRQGRYNDIDYGVPPEPPLEGDDATWARELFTPPIRGE